MKKPSKSSIQEADLHWNNYVGKLLQIHRVPENYLPAAEYIYKSSFVHGWKHGVESREENSRWVFFVSVLASIFGSVCTFYFLRGF